MFLSIFFSTHLPRRLLLCGGLFFFGLIVSATLSSVGSAYGAGAISALNNALSRLRMIEPQLIRLEYGRREALRNFVEIHGGAELLRENISLIDDLAAMSDHNRCSFTRRTRLNRMLSNAIGSARERRQLINDLELPPFPETDLENLQNFLVVLLHELRVPEGYDDYRYANHIMQPGGHADSQDLIAHHEIGNWQEYHKTFRQKIYRIGMYSPSRSGLFRGNRDIYLKDMELTYYAQGERKHVVHEYERFLRRGESLDYQLPEIAEEITIIIRFACRPEHRGEALFVVEPELAYVRDHWDSPFAMAVEAVKNFEYERKTVTELQHSINHLIENFQKAINVAVGLGQ